MRDFLRKWLTPWAASDLFSEEAAFAQFLSRRHRSAQSWRMLWLVVAAGCLLLGVVLDRRPIQLLTAVPLLLVLACTVAMERMEAVMDRQDHTKS